MGGGGRDEGVVPPPFFLKKYLKSICNQPTFNWYSVHQTVLLKVMIRSVLELFLFQIQFVLTRSLVLKPCL